MKKGEEAEKRPTRRVSRGQKKGEQREKTKRTGERGKCCGCLGEAVGDVRSGTCHLGKLCRQ